MNAPTRQIRERKRVTGRQAALMGKGMEKARMENFLIIEEIHYRAETITPLLQTLLAFEPRPYWNR